MTAGYMPHYCTYRAHCITRQGRGEDTYAKNHSTAQVETKSHQVNAALFALPSPLFRGDNPADEVVLAETIEASQVIAQRWAERP